MEDQGTDWLPGRLFHEKAQRVSFIKRPSADDCQSHRITVELLSVALTFRLTPLFPVSIDDLVLRNGALVYRR